jgi:hypothetical protein
MLEPGELYGDVDGLMNERARFFDNWHFMASSSGTVRLYTRKCGGVALRRSSIAQLGQEYVCLFFGKDI